MNSLRIDFILKQTEHKINIVKWIDAKSGPGSGTELHGFSRQPQPEKQSILSPRTVCQTSEEETEADTPQPPPTTTNPQPPAG